MSRRRARRNRIRRAVDRRAIKVAGRRLADQTIQADKVTFRDWLRAVAHKRLRVIAAHPHHYATAAGLSGFLYVSGHAEKAAIVAAFGYAVIENIVSAADSK